MPSYWDFTFFAFVHTINANKNESLGMRTIPVDLFPASIGAQNRLIRLHAVFATDVVGAPVTIQLLDVTLGGVPLTNSVLTGNSLSPIEQVSPLPGIPVTNAPGGLFTIGAPHILELDVVTPAGVKCILSGAWVSVDYV